MVSGSGYIRWFDTLRLEDVPLVGGKNCSLGELYRELGARGVQVPNGFAITVSAYYDFLQKSNVWAKLQSLLWGLNIADVAELAKRGAEARRIVYDASGGSVLREQIVEAYAVLERQYVQAATGTPGEGLDAQVRERD